MSKIATIEPKRSPDLLFSAKLDGHVGLNDVLLLHTNGKWERITRKLFEQKISGELAEGGMNVREPIEPKKPNNKRSRTTGNVKHKQGDARRSAGKRKLPVRKAKSQQPRLFTK